MRILIVLLVLSILGNIFGLYVLYKFFQKDKTLQATLQQLQQKDRVLDKVNRSLDKRLVFIHHSVGRNWLSEGGLRDSLTSLGVGVRSVTRGCPLGEDTDMYHWVPKFENNLDQIIRFDASPDLVFAGLEENDIIMFKSCYPNSDIVAEGSEPGDPLSDVKTTSDYKAVFHSLKGIIAQHPDKKFIYVTAPPLVVSATTPGNAKRARDFNDWVKTEFAAQYRQETELNNFLVFDLFDVLTNQDNFLKQEFARSEHDSHPNTAGNRAATREFLEFVQREGVFD